MKYEYIKPFSKDSFDFYGCYVVLSKNNKNLLVSKAGTTLICSNDLINQLVCQNISDDFMFLLVQRYFGHVDGDNYAEYVDDKTQVKYFILDLTKKCNFNCIYCFRDEKQIDTISFEELNVNLDSIKRYYFEQNLSHLAIQAWGGEPLLALDKIEYMRNYFETNKMDVAIDVETNGGLIDVNIARRLKKSKVRVGVSIDGPSNIQNLQRKSYGSKNSFEIVKKGIDILQKELGSIGSITVITKYNVNHIDEILDCFENELKLKHLKFNVVRDNSYSRTPSLCPTPQEVSKMYEKLFNRMIIDIQTDHPFIESNIRDRVLNLVLNVKNNCCNSKGCKGGRSLISIDHRGNMYPCEMTDFENEKLGNIKNGSILDQIENSRKSNRYFIEKKNNKCLTCPWYPFCKGGCSSRQHYLNKNGEIDLIECAMNETLYPLVGNLIINNPDITMKIVGGKL